MISFDEYYIIKIGSTCEYDLRGNLASLVESIFLHFFAFLHLLAEAYVKHLFASFKNTTSGKLFLTFKIVSTFKWVSQMFSNNFV